MKFLGIVGGKRWKFKEFAHQPSTGMSAQFVNYLKVFKLVICPQES